MTAHLHIEGRGDRELPDLTNREVVARLYAEAAEVVRRSDEYRRRIRKERARAELHAAWRALWRR
jgi:hypothetical protein